MTSSENAKEPSRLFLPLLGVFIVIYLMLGAIIFSLIEAPNEIELRKIMKEEIRNMSAELNVSLEKMTSLFLQYDLLVLNGYTASDLYYEESHTNKWSFIGAFTFCGTVVTTIGFGVATPKTTAGRIVFIFYCLLGCPAVFLFFNTWLSRFITYFTKFISWVKSKRKSKPKIVRNRFGQRKKRESYKASPFHVLLALSSITLFIVFMTSLMYHVTESDWSYLTSFYYTITAYSTIGFGDLTSGQEHSYQNINRYLYHVIDGLLLVIGCCCVYSLFNMISLFIKQFVDYLINFLKRKCSSMTSDDDDSDVPGDDKDMCDIRLSNGRNHKDVIVYVKDNLKQVGHVYSGILASSIRNDYYGDSINNVGGHDVMTEVEPPTSANVSFRISDEVNSVEDKRADSDSEDEKPGNGRRMWGALKTTLRVTNSRQKISKSYSNKSTLRETNSNNAHSSTNFSVANKTSRWGAARRHFTGKSRKSTKQKKSVRKNRSVRLNNSIFTPIRPYGDFASPVLRAGLRRSTSAPERVGYDSRLQEGTYYRVSRSMYASDFRNVQTKRKSENWDETNDVFPLSIMQNQMGM
ncbi:uncharacterized protein LOC120348681 [Styela clava]